jgi:hypothetical protein
VEIRRKIWLLLLLAPAIARAEGGMTSGDLGESASKDKSEFPQPWFVGEKEVTYCIDRGDDFSASLDEAREDIGTAVGDWGQTLSQIPQAPLPGKGKIASRYREVPCGEEHELTFYLGKQPPEVVEALAKEKYAPAALSHVTGYDPGTGRARGFVWLAADRGEHRFEGVFAGAAKLNKMPEDFWAEKNRRFHAVLHELGHVNGFPHVPFSVMSQETIQLINPNVASHVRRMTSASFLASPKGFKPGEPFCVRSEDFVPRKQGGQLPDRDGYTSRICLDLGGRSLEEAVRGGVGLELSQAPKGTPTPPKANGCPDAIWTPARGGRLFGMKPVENTAVKVAGRYRNMSGKMETHEFFRVTAAQNWEGWYRSDRGDLCPAKLGVFGRQAFRLLLACGTGEAVVGYFPDSPIWAPATGETDRN